MFEVFKDIYAEINGLDPDKLLEEKIKMKENKEKKFINLTSKIIITVAGILYLVLAFVNLSVIIRNGFSPFAIKYILLSLLSISIIISIQFKKREYEIAAMIGIFVFIISNFMFRNF